MDEYERSRLRGKPLSSGERCVLDKLKEGLQNKQIAKELGITENTVKSQLQRVYAKLAAKNRAEAVDRAYKVGYYKVARRDL